MTRSKRPKLSEKIKCVDVPVYNDSSVLAFYTHPSGPNAPTIRSEKEAVENELGFILPLCQDDSYVMRVRLGTPTAAEKREFVGFAAGHMDLTSGVLLSGESSVQIPKKRYRIEVRSYLPHSMAVWQLGQVEKSLKLGKYWRETHEKEFPEWLRWICWNHPQDDPGYEKEWNGLNEIEPVKSAYVDFLVCLQPPSTKKPLSKLKKNGLAEWENRRPELCPKGLKAPGIPADSLEEDDEYY